MRRLTLAALCLCALPVHADETGIEAALQALRVKDYAIAHTLLELLAQDGDAEAQYRLAALYRGGQGVTKDPARAAEWLQRAAAQGHVSAQRQLETFHAHGRGKPGGDTPLPDDLHAALRADDPERLRALLRAGANPDPPDAERPVLIDAAAEGRLAGVSVLIEYGANPDRADRYGETPLLAAATAGQVAVVDALLAHGAAPDLADRQGNTPLHRAAQTGHADVVERLLARGAAHSPRNRAGQTPLDAARAHGHAALAGRLVAGGATRGIDTSPPVRPKKKEAARDTAEDAPEEEDLLTAARRGHTDTVQALIAAGASVHVRDRLGRTALHAAIAQRDPRMFEVLLAAGATPDRAALEEAAAFGRRPMVDRLLARHRFDRRDLGAALRAAARAGQHAVIGPLVSAGADPDDRDPLGQTSLALAALGGHTETIRVLIAAGADPAIRTTAGDTPHDLARATGHAEAMAALEDK